MIIFDLFKKKDLTCPGIRYGITAEELCRVEKHVGKIENQTLLDYLHRHMPVWPANEIEERYVAPDLLDLDTVLEEIQEMIPSIYMAKHGFLPISNVGNGDIVMFDVKTGRGFTCSHESVNSQEAAEKCIEKIKWLYEDVVSFAKHKASGYGWIH